MLWGKYTVTCVYTEECVFQFINAVKVTVVSLTHVERSIGKTSYRLPVVTSDHQDTWRKGGRGKEGPKDSLRRLFAPTSQ